MRRLALFAVVVPAVAATPAIAFVVLGKNLPAGTYPTNADSIGIPFGESLMVSALVLLLLAFAIAGWGRRGWAGRARNIAFGSAAVVSGLYGLAWTDEHHWPIAAAYLFVAFGAALVPVMHARVRNSRRAEGEV